jgi:protein SCO1/2
MNNNMRKIYDEFKDEENFMIVSHTSDPATDSAAKLKRYSDSLKVDTDKWVFLTGRKDSLYQTARISYLLDDPKNNVKDVNDDFMHTQFIALVDKNGKVRGQIYDGLKASDLAKLKDNIQDLLKEKAGESGFANSIFTNNPQ